MGKNSLDIPGLKLVNNAPLKTQWRRQNFHKVGIGEPSIKKPGYMSFSAWKKAKGLNTGGKISKYYKGGGNVITGR
tara:strand:- start:2309 stop:2536 length:228 start_codon:yes stop_codon:yes gene_type:complete